MVYLVGPRSVFFRDGSDYMERQVETRRRGLATTVSFGAPAQVTSDSPESTGPTRTFDDRKRRALQTLLVVKVVKNTVVDHEAQS